MRTRFIIIFTALMTLAVALALQGCMFPTATNNHALLTRGAGNVSHDSTGNGNPPPPPGPEVSIGVSGDSLATAGNPSFLELFVANNTAAADSVIYQFTGPQGWSGFPVTGSLGIAGGASTMVGIPVAVPNGTVPGVYLFHYVIGKPDGTQLQSGNFGLSVHSN